MIGIFLCFLLQGPVLTETPPEVLQSFQNSNSLILVFSDSNRSPDYEKAMSELARDPLGLDSRDLLIFEIFLQGGINPDGSSLTDEETSSLRDFFHVRTSEFYIIVLDKMLQEKFRTKQPVALKEIFDAID